MATKLLTGVCIDTISKKTYSEGEWSYFAYPSMMAFQLKSWQTLFIKDINVEINLPFTLSSKTLKQWLGKYKFTTISGKALYTFCCC